MPEIKKIELLLPAGNWDCLKAAVENGADAVYFGIDKFNARRRASNFELNKLKEVIDYCHTNGVRAYCTLNILIKNSELKEYFETVKKLYLAGIDAVIIQHLSFLPILKRNFPDLDIHLSTQSAISNSYFLPLIKGADRIVLPREYSKEEIIHFISKTGVPVEVFVQGALCFCYSGKCLFSSVIGGRSGNRGLCAQPCRRAYNGEYLLSMKDLSLIEQLPEIIEMGISSLKIEGRLRSTNYVTAAAKTYRAAIDSYYAGKFSINEEALKELELSFNREFTKGYFHGEKDLVSPERPMGRGLLLGTMERDNFIKLRENLLVGDGLGIWLKDKVDGAVLRQMEKEKHSVTEAKRGDYVKLFIRAPIGTKIYKTSSVKDPIIIKFQKNKPITILKRADREIILPEIKSLKNPNSEILVKVYSTLDVENALKNGADKAFYNIFAEDFDKVKDKAGAYVPRILNDAEVEKAVSLIERYKVKNILIGDLGVYAKLKTKELTLYLDYSSNIFNDYDLLFFDKALPIISPELNFNELKELKQKNFAVLVQGRVVLMNTKYPNLPNSLKDEKNYTFPVRKEHTYYQILNSIELGLFEEINKLKAAGVNQLFLDLDQNVGPKVRWYKDILSGKKVEVNKKNYTKGHWERGVE